jgi:hypothetical protein
MRTVAVNEGAFTGATHGALDRLEAIDTTITSTEIAVRETLAGPGSAFRQFT